MQKSSGNTITAFPTMQACLYCLQRVEHRQALKIKKNDVNMSLFVRVTNTNIFWKYIQVWLHYSRFQYSNPIGFLHAVGVLTMMSL